MILLQAIPETFLGLNDAQQINMLLIIGGLIVALLLNRFVLSKFYARFARWVERQPAIEALDFKMGSLGRIIEVVLNVSFVAVASMFLLTVMGVDTTSVQARLNDAGTAIWDWTAPRAVRITIIVALGYFAHQLLTRTIPPLIRRQLKRHKDGIALDEATKRADALGQVTRYAVNVSIALIVVLTTLAELGIDITPLLATVGVVGIALGFGAQNLVKDVLAGLFIIGENQYAVGDVVSIAGLTGLVEAVNLRRTIMRDLDGVVHIIPNGQLTTASNFTKTFSRVNIDIEVAYKEDLDRVIRVLNRVGRELADDDYFGALIIDPPQVLRVNGFNDSGIAIKVLGVTKPIRQWEVTGELRRRIKREFDRERIEIPFPHRTLYWGVGAHPGSDPATAPKPPTAQDTLEQAIESMISRDPWARQPRPAEDDAVEGSDEGTAVPTTTGSPRSILAHLDSVRDVLAYPPTCIFTDIDGSIAAIAANPDAVKISPAMRQALGQLARSMHVVALTGRDAANAQRLLGLTSIVYAGNHGVEVWEKGQITFPPEARPLTRQVHALSRASKGPISEIRGVSIEDKGFSITYHYRNAPNPREARRQILEYLSKASEARGMPIREGKMVVEVRLPIELDKGVAMQRFISERGIKSAIVIGDDLTDVDSFKMLARLRSEGVVHGIAIAVLASHTPEELTQLADFSLTNTEATELFMSWLATEARAPR